MPLPASTTDRRFRHVRRTVIEAFQRSDGLWDLEAHLTDVKPDVIELPTELRPAGVPMHDMWLRVTINTRFKIIDAVAAMDYAPHTGSCENIVPDYSRLVGLNLMRNFRAGVRERFPKLGRCTHLSELADQLPTAAVQALYRDVPMPDETVKPFPIDQCHANRSDGEVVRILYPKWHRKSQTGTESARMGAEQMQNSNEDI